MPLFTLLKETGAGQPGKDWSFTYKYLLLLLCLPEIHIKNSLDALETEEFDVISGNYAFKMVRIYMRRLSGPRAPFWQESR